MPIRFVTRRKKLPCILFAIAKDWKADVTIILDVILVSCNQWILLSSNLGRIHGFLKGIVIVRQEYSLD